MMEAIKCVGCREENLHPFNEHRIEANGDYKIYLWCEHCPSVTVFSHYFHEGSFFVDTSKPKSGFELACLFEAEKARSFSEGLNKST